MRDLHEIGQVDGETGLPHPTKSHSLVPIFVLAHNTGCSPSDILDMEAELYFKYSAWVSGLNKGRRIKEGS